jgi:hypothetical protein
VLGPTAAAWKCLNESKTNQLIVESNQIGGNAAPFSVLT